MLHDTGGEEDISIGGELVICLFKKNNVLGSYQVVVMLTKGLHIDRSHFHSTNHWLFNDRWFFAKQMSQVALFPTPIRSVNGAIFIYAQEQSVDDNLTNDYFSQLIQIQTRN